MNNGTLFYRLIYGVDFFTWSYPLDIKYFTKKSLGFTKGFENYDTYTIKHLCAIEFDGDYHREYNNGIKNDKKKNFICEQVGFKLIKINSREIEKDLK